MKMKINNQLLKQKRNERCWSQEQLAEMTGLSLRTVQRIEAKGVASKESVKSLAAVLELPSTELIQLDKEAALSASMLKDSESQPEPLQPEKLKKQYLWGIVAALVANLVGFLGIYLGYSDGKINRETMAYLSSLVSCALLFSTSLLTYKAWKQGILKSEL